MSRSMHPVDLSKMDLMNGTDLKVGLSYMVKGTVGQGFAFLGSRPRF